MREIDEINWDDIYMQLYAYTDQMLKAHIWFGKAESDSYLKGMQVHDYIAAAIEKFLVSPEKFDPSYGRSLINYLKKHIIRSLISNDAKSLENKTATGNSIFENSSDDDEASNVFESLLPFVYATFDQTIDYEKIMNEIYSEIQNDIILTQIFEGTCKNRMKRREIILEFKMKESDFDNGMKRLKTVLNYISKKYSLSKTL